jgi:hypothetical protein
MAPRQLTFQLDNNAGSVTLDLSQITEIKENSTYTTLSTKDAGWFYVQLGKRERAELYRLIADRLDLEVAEADRIVQAIK